MKLATGHYPRIVFIRVIEDFIALKCYLFLFIVLQPLFISLTTYTHLVVMAEDDQGPKSSGFDFRGFTSSKQTLCSHSESFKGGGGMQGFTCRIP